ncbi:Germin-like protein subfamily 1 member 13 [Vitis vinifera]|uniref:Germin-like protein subfamily 1 member 13 n=1 Tax=Vitis vinifera TaxID=29760 RepID=A0A438KC04_VITVI|nr:Germin-like protein subfamily 1 member 13 [Vitis vinifera]
MKKGVSFLVAIALMALASSLAAAFDPSPLQDTCVAIPEPKNAVFVNGKFCKNPNLTVAEDFFFQGLNIPGNTANRVGSNVTTVNVDAIPGLNTLGISLVRIDYAPYGQNPPHTHPRATEILTVLEGTLLVGFVTSNPQNRLFSKVLNKGDVFVFPIGLIHFQFNIGHTNAVAIAGLNSQNPGVITIADAVFGSNPPINPDFLARAFQLDKKIKIVIVGDSSLTMKKGVSSLVTVALMALASSLASAFDPRPLQDTCVAIDEPENVVFVNGKFCKNPNLTVADDFLYQGLNIPGNTANLVGSNVTIINVDVLPGQNTLGISLVRIDYAPYGQNPPHIHPRASEILTVLEGTLLVGFVTSNPQNRFISKVLNKGDVFVFPIGLIHFQFNIGHTNAVAIAALNSQNPGVITIANAVFGSNPPINPDFLARAFQLDKKVVEYLQARF